MAGGFAQAQGQQELLVETNAPSPTAARHPPQFANWHLRETDGVLASQKSPMGPSYPERIARLNSAPHQNVRKIIRGPSEMHKPARQIASRAVLTSARGARRNPVRPWPQLSAVGPAPPRSSETLQHTQDDPCRTPESASDTRVDEGRRSTPGSEPTTNVWASPANPTTSPLTNVTGQSRYR